jgi:tetratricopeptide (TPR) repeat protein
VVRSRELAVVLLTDLAYSTAVASETGNSDTMHLLRHQHDLLVEPSIDALGGERLASTGDGLIAAFRSVDDALRASIDIQQAFDAHNRSSQPVLGVRVAVTVGEMRREADGLYGAAITEAARLCKATSPGQILCSEAVRLLALDVVGIEVVPAPPRAFRGFPGLTSVNEVRWTPRDTHVTRVSLPAGVTGFRDLPLAGRIETWQTLQREWAMVGLRRPRVVTLHGESGVGKTRLARELCLATHRAGSMVMFGRGMETTTLAYQPIHDAIAPIIAEMPAHELRAHLGPSLADLAPLVPSIGPARHPSAGSHVVDRYRMFAAVEQFFRAVSAEQRIVLVLDDFHAADSDTIELVSRLAGSDALSRVLLVATIRADVKLGDRLAALLDDLNRTDQLLRVDVGPLSRDEVAALLDYEAEATGRTSLATSADAFHSASDGNPFYALELLRAAREQDSLDESVTKADLLNLAPAGLASLISRRVAALPPGGPEFVEWAAVAGDEASLSLIEQVMDADHSTASSATLVRQAISLGLLRDTGSEQLRFQHALAGSILYQSIVPVVRGRMHLKIADALEVKPGVVEAAAIAGHLLSAPADLVGERAAWMARRAGDEALRRLAPGEAVRWLSSAVDRFAALCPESDDWLEAIERLGAAQRRAGLAEGRDTLARAADLASARGRIDVEVAALRSDTRGFFSQVGGVDEERIGRLRRCLEHPDLDPVVMAELLAQLSTELRFVASADDRRAMGLAVIDVARKHGDIRLEIEAILAVDPIALTEADRCAELQQARDQADQLDDIWLRIRVRWLLSTALMAQGSAGAARETSREAVDLSTQLGEPSLLWASNIMQIGALCSAGRLTEAENLAFANFELGASSGQPDTYLYTGAAIIQIRFDQGRLSEVVSQIEESLHSGDPWPLAQAFLALALAETGRCDQARALVEEVIDHLPPDDGSDLPAAALCTASLAIGVLGDAELAHRALTLVTRSDHEIVGPGPTPLITAGHVTGVLQLTAGLVDAALDSLSAAIARHRELEAPVWRARSEVAYARALIAGGGDPEVARRHALSALATARDLGSAGIDAEAVELLASLPTGVEGGRGLGR